MKMQNIIKETVKYYKINPRGKYDFGCVYLGKDGRKCAVGRCLLPEILQKTFEKSITGAVDELVDSLGHLDTLLIKKYRGKAEKFWIDLQDFHDDNCNWIENDLGGNNLTELGEQEYKKLLNEFTE